VKVRRAQTNRPLATRRRQGIRESIRKPPRQGNAGCATPEGEDVVVDTHAWPRPVERDYAPTGPLSRLAAHDRPREKLGLHGAASLGDNELVAIILTKGSRRQNVLELANQLLIDVGGVPGLPRVSFDQLRGLFGVGAAKAAQMLAAVELGRRTFFKLTELSPPLLSASEAAAFLAPRYGARGVEQFGILLLDTRHRVIRSCVLTVGVLDMSLVHPREVFREAALGGASALILFHNHPSRDPAPSHEDVMLTQRMVQCGEMMCMQVLDHLILADNRFFSFRESGMLNGSAPTAAWDQPPHEAVTP